MASVYFKCDCGKDLAMNVLDAGHQAQCHGCGKPVLVPPPELSWTCACGEAMAAPKNLAGVSVCCSACGAEHTVPVRLELKHATQPRNKSSPDLPRVPAGRTNDIQCSKCGYLCAAVLMRCPRCQNHLHKGAVIRRQCLKMARVLFIIGLGWFLASHFLRISDYVKDLLGMAMIQRGSRVDSPSNSENVAQTSATDMPAGK